MNDEDWYLLDRAGRRYGPYERAAVEALHQRGELREDTPLWHPGLARWQPAARLLRFPVAGAEPRVPRPAAAPQLPVAPAPRAAAAGPRARTGAPARPRATVAPARASRPPAAPTAPAATAASAQLARDRVLAAATDLLLVALLLSLPPLAGTALHWQPLLGAGRFTWLLVWGLADAALLSRIGTTPGRALYGLRVTGADGRPLPGDRALLRSALVVLTVLGLGHPFFALVLGVVAWRAITSRGAGWWDLAAGSTVVRGSDVPWRRAIAPLLLIVLAFVLLVLHRHWALTSSLRGGFV